MGYDNRTNFYYNGNAYMQPNYGQNNMLMQQQQQIPQSNIIYVAGKQGAEFYMCQPNTETFMIDNNGKVGYRKKVYPDGRFEVQEYNITEKKTDEQIKNIDTIDLSEYVKKSDFDTLKSEFETLKSKFTDKSKTEVKL